MELGEGTYDIWDMGYVICDHVGLQKHHVGLQNHHV